MMIKLARVAKVTANTSQLASGDALLNYMFRYDQNFASYIIILAAIVVRCPSSLSELGNIIV
jgi:hypothetical protein